MTGVGSGIDFKQVPFGGAVVTSGRIAVITEGNWTATASTQDSSMYFQTCLNGSLGTALTLASDKAATFTSTITGTLLYSTYAGTVKTVTDFITISNTGQHADMDGTGTAILFRQAASDAVTYDSGKIYVATETDWTSTASTRDSSLYFQVALNGALTTKMKISSSNNIYLSPSTTSESNEFIFNNNGIETVLFSIDSKANAWQSGLRFLKNGATAWTIVARNELDAPNNRLAFYYGASTQCMYIDTTGRVDINQSGSAAAVEALTLTQADVSEGFINFVGTDGGAVATPANSAASVKIEVNGTVRTLLLYA
jgi:hypothetical protein